MRNKVLGKMLGALLIAALLCGTGLLRAEQGESSQVVGGVSIYVGVLPAQMIAMQPKEHHETNMHRGAPGWGEQYHVMVSLFEHVKWTPIADAGVTVSVTDARSPGQRVRGPQKQLERMAVAGSMAYGNYFNMPGLGPYRIDIEIRRPGTQQPIKAAFDYRHAMVSAIPRPGGPR